MVEDNSQLDPENYKALFEFQQKQHESVKAQSARLDDKASKYLTFTSLLIAALSLFAKSYFFELDTAKHSFLQYPIIGLIFFSFISLACISRFLFICLKTNQVEKLSSKHIMVEYFLDNSLPTVYYELSKQIAGIIDGFDRVNHEKVNCLNRAFEEIKTCGLLLVLSVILIALDLIIA